MWMRAACSWGAYACILQIRSRHWCRPTASQASHTAVHNLTNAGLGSRTSGVGNRQINCTRTARRKLRKVMLGVGHALHRCCPSLFNMLSSRWILLYALLCLRINSIARARSLPNTQGQAQQQEVDVGWLGNTEHLAEGTHLLLCECEPAEGPPSGLSCAKEGWFISSFEKQGEWMGGGGLVPLSRAICCRPCMPSAVPDHPNSIIHPNGGPGGFDADGQIEVHEQQSTARTRAGQQHRRQVGWAPTTATLLQLGEHAQEQADGVTQQQASATPAAMSAPDSQSQLKYTNKHMTDGHASGQQPIGDSILNAMPFSLQASKPLGFVSVGCHPPSSASFSPLACEPNGNSFVTDIWYPYGQVECCTPALLLASGDLWPLERCNCGQSWTKECGGLETHKLLSGFADWRVSGTGDLIPVAPLQCCQLCLAAAPMPAPSLACHDLSDCHGNGICVLGSCQCFEGYGGADCSVPARSGADMLLDMPWWALCLTLFGVVLVLYGIVVAGRTTYDAVQNSQQARQAGTAGGDRPGGTGNATLDQLALPLLLQYLDEEGSAGSHDTDGEEAAHEAAEASAEPSDATEGGAVQHRQHLEGRSMEVDSVQAGETEQGRQGEALVLHTPRSMASSDRSEERAEFLEGAAESAAAAAGHAGNTEQLDTVGSPAGSPSAGGAACTGGEEGHGEGRGGSDEEGSQGDGEASCASPAHHAAASVAVRNDAVGSVCVVCMETPVQVALVPCGHAVACRKCSRRLTHCPLCRKLIGRRQRLYFSFGSD